MRILILGNTGFIGRAIARLAAERGKFVAGLSRHAQKISDPTVEQHLGDRAQTDRILEIVRSRRLDTVVDAAAFTFESSAPLIKALDGAVTRYIVLSSGDVYLNYGIINRRDEGVPNETWLDEESPLRQSRFPYRSAEPRAASDPLKWMDDYDKIPIEAIVRGMRQTQWTILRLSMVYGPGDRLNRFLWIVGPIKMGAEQVSVPRAWARWRTTYGYVDNVAAGTLLAATHELAARATFNLGEAEPSTHMEWAHRFAAAMNWTGTIEESDDPDLPLAHLTARMNLAQPLLMSTVRIRNTLGYKEIVSLGEGIVRTTHR